MTEQTETAAYRATVRESAKEAERDEPGLGALSWLSAELRALASTPPTPQDAELALVVWETARELGVDEASLEAWVAGE